MCPLISTQIKNKASGDFTDKKYATGDIDIASRK